MAKCFTRRGYPYRRTGDSFRVLIAEMILQTTKTDQAARNYPDTFLTKIGKKKVPDTYIIGMALKKAKTDKWHYVRGDWVKGWKLTQQGIQFAKDVERRVKKTKGIF